MSKKIESEQVEPKQPTPKEVANAIREFSDMELIQLYQLAISQLETIALGFKNRLEGNLVKIRSKVD